MIVYRVETEERMGPYYGDGPWPRNFHELSFSPKPQPSSISHEEYCAFNSIEQLLAWFDCPRDREALEEEGYRVVAINVRKDRVFEDACQVLVRKRKTGYSRRTVIEWDHINSLADHYQNSSK